MNKTLKRALSGTVYVAIMWFGTSFQGTFHILFFLILLLSLYEMYKLRKGKTSFMSYLYVIIPLSLIHKIETELILFMFILTWTFDTFAYLIGVNFGKHKILPSISPKGVGED